MTNTKWILQAYNQRGCVVYVKVAGYDSNSNPVYGLTYNPWRAMHLDIDKEASAVRKQLEEETGWVWHPVQVDLVVRG